MVTNSPPIIGSEVHETDQGYATDKDGQPILFTDWTVKPIFHIAVNGSDAKTIFEVELDGEPVQIPSRLFDTVQNMRTWCHSRDLSWNGNQSQLEGLRQLISRADVPWRTGITEIGLHSHSFVLPDEVIGEQNTYVYVEPAAGAEHWQGAIHLQHSDDWLIGNALGLLAELHRPEVMTPILGWLAAAPLRSLCAEFPPLAVLGGAGYGKTTLIGTALTTLGFKSTEPMNLTASTLYGIATYCASSNGLPVWIDEWRANTGRDEARQACAQIIRDSWNGASSIKGGGGDNRMGLVTTTSRAPLIISGEGQLSERSHLERCVVVQVGPEGRNVNALRELHSVDEHGMPEHPPFGLGRAYIEFLQHEVISNGGRPPSHSSAAGDRNEHGLAVVRWGYETLGWFADSYNMELPEFDESKVRADAEAEQEDSPIIRVLAAADHAAHARGADSGVYVYSNGDTYVRPEVLASWFAKEVHDADMALPGGSKTIRELLKAEFNAEHVNNHLHGRAWRFPTPPELRRD